MKKHNYKRQNMKTIGVIAFAITFSCICFVIISIYAAENSLPVSNAPPSDTASASSDLVPSEPLSPPLIPTAVPGGVAEVDGPEDMKLTDDELNELYEILHAAETELYYEPSESSSSDDAASGAADDIPSKAADDGVSQPDNPSDGIKKTVWPTERPPYRAVSVCFEDYKSGYSFSYNSEQEYFVASLIKAPYCTYLYNLAEKGKCDLEETLSIEYSQVRDGTGKINQRPKEDFPVSYTVNELIELALHESDNTAVERLRQRYPADGFTKYAESVGIKNISGVKSVTNGTITAQDANAYIKAVYDYIETGKYGERLKEYMSNTKNPLIRSDYPIVRKYGWTPLAMHDMAVVYAPQSPYFITILTNRDMGKASDYKLFSDISKTLQKFYDKRYPPQ